MSYMYDSIAPRRSDRRTGTRLRMQLFLNQYIRDRPYRALALDISETGLSLQKLTEPIVRPARTVALELELPGTQEVIWASAEARFDTVGADFHVSGLRFAAMARKHQRLLHDYVRERRERIARLLGRYPLPC
jgi:c-di-GMP-binding flagellar brake protein YcgR